MRFDLDPVVAALHVHAMQDRVFHDWLERETRDIARPRAPAAMPYPAVKQFRYRYRMERRPDGGIRLRPAAPLWYNQ